MLKPSSLLNFPVFGAFSVVLGVLLERLELPFWAAFVVAALALPALLSKFPQAVRYALVLALLLCPLAWWRSHTTRTLPDNLEPFIGQTITLSGDYDGRFFGTGATRVFLRVKPALEMGVYTITGKLERPKWLGIRVFLTLGRGCCLEVRGMSSKQKKSLHSSLVFWGQLGHGCVQG